MNVLEQICADKAVHLKRMMDQTPLDSLQKQLEEQEEPRGFIKHILGKKPAIIAEVKKASPSKGVIRADFDPVAIARTYADHGAACLSVLTDEKYFQGADSYLVSVKAAVSLPVLRKDFMIDTYQIYESRSLGADCILLIMAALDDERAQAFYDLSVSLGMDVLIEVHDAREMERALALRTDPARAMIGVNNRDLKSLVVNRQTGLALSRHIPAGYVGVAESGLETPQDIAAFAAHGYRAFLIGESLMRQPDIGAALKKIQAPC